MPYTGESVLVTAARDGQVCHVALCNTYTHTHTHTHTQTHTHTHTHLLAHPLTHKVRCLILSSTGSLVASKRVALHNDSAHKVQPVYVLWFFCCNDHVHLILSRL